MFVRLLLKKFTAEHASQDYSEHNRNRTPHKVDDSTFCSLTSDPLLQVRFREWKRYSGMFRCLGTFCSLPDFLRLDLWIWDFLNVGCDGFVDFVNWDSKQKWGQNCPFLNLDLGMYWLHEFLYSSVFLFECLDTTFFYYLTRVRKFFTKETNTQTELQTWHYIPWFPDSNPIHKLRYRMIYIYMNPPKSCMGENSTFQCLYAHYSIAHVQSVKGLLLFPQSWTPVLKSGEVLKKIKK